MKNGPPRDLKMWQISRSDRACRRLSFETFVGQKKMNPIKNAVRRNVLALDPGFRNTGWATLNDGRIESCGCIRTEPTKKKKAIRVADEDAECCQLIARQLAVIIKDQNIGGIVAELPSAGAKGARAIGCMARASAIVATLAELLAIPSEWVTPQAVKQITGSKTASKEEVETAVLRRWPDAPLPKAKCEREHVSDALGAYLAAENGTLVRLLNGAHQND